MMADLERAQMNEMEQKSRMLIQLESNVAQENMTVLYRKETKGVWHLGGREDPVKSTDDVDVDSRTERLFALKGECHIRW